MNVANYRQLVVLSDHPPVARDKIRARRERDRKRGGGGREREIEGYRDGVDGKIRKQ